MIKKGSMVFHIGLHNTGSSWLQEEFFPLIEDAFVVSNEDLSGLPWHIGHGVEFRDMLMYGLFRLYPDARIVIGVREKKSWVDALYGHYVKRGGVLGFGDWLENFDMRLCDFQSYVDCLKSLFKSGVFVYSFEDFKSDKYLSSNPRRIPGTCCAPARCMQMQFL